MEIRLIYYVRHISLIFCSSYNAPTLSRNI